MPAIPAISSSTTGRATATLSLETLKDELLLGVRRPSIIDALTSISDTNAKTSIAKELKVGTKVAALIATLKQ